MQKDQQNHWFPNEKLPSDFFPSMGMQPIAPNGRRKNVKCLFLSHYCNTYETTRNYDRISPDFLTLSA